MIVTLEDADGNQLGHDSIWGIESCENPGYGYYWQETAAEMVNALASEWHEKEAARVASEKAEAAEREHWEARDTVTVR